VLAGDGLQWHAATSLLFTIERTLYTTSTLIQHVCVDHRRGNVLVAE
jgi:hypothetical protein